MDEIIFKLQESIGEMIGMKKKEKLYEGVETADPDTEVMPDIETTPSTPTTPRKNPLAPKPGVQPKPKATLHDAELFLGAIGSSGPIGESMNEEFEGVHSDKLAYINNMDDRELKELLPDLDDGQISYLKKITSPYYDELVKKLERWTGIKVSSSRQLPALTQLVYETLQKIVVEEQENVDALEELAMEAVLNLDEFKMAKEAYEDGLVGFDIKLRQPEAEDLELENNEETHELNQALLDIFEGVDENTLRRRMANLMTHGGSIPKLYLFNMVSDELNKIIPNVTALYGIVASIVEAGYWLSPDGIEVGAARDSGGMGSAHVKPDEDGYIIKARGLTFPFLVHEIAKGIYEWLSLDPDLQNVMNAETVQGETKDVLVGPALRKKFVDMVPDDKMYLLPLIQKYYLGMKPEEMKAILSGDQGKLNQLIKQAQEDWGMYQESKKENGNA